MSALWLSISDAAVRLRLSPQQVLAMAVSGELHSRLDGDHREVCAGAVAALVEQQRMPVPVSELAAHGGDDQTAGPTFTPWTRAEDPDAFNDRATPNDEGDEQQ